VGGVVGEVGGNSGEEVLVALAVHEVAVGERRLAEQGQLVVACAVHADGDAALVLKQVADLVVAEEIGLAAGGSLRQRGVGVR
jgi:hypothetical protein